MAQQKLVITLLTLSAMIMLGMCGEFDSQIRSLFSNTQTGDGTYYGYTSGGSCTLDPTPASGQVDKNAAMNAPQYYGSATCGMCLQMTGNGEGSGNDPIKGTYIVYINNLCPECKSGDLDLGDNPPGDGRWDIDWIAVPCPGNIGNIQYMAQGSHEYYLKLQVRNHRIPVGGVSIKQGNQYIALKRTEDNFFISSGNVEYPLSDPINIRVTSIEGESLDDQVTLADIVSGKPFNSKTGIQFSADDVNTSFSTPVETSVTSLTSVTSVTSFFSSFTSFLTSLTSVTSNTSFFTSFTSFFSSLTSNNSSNSSASSLAASFALIFVTLLF